MGLADGKKTPEEQAAIDSLALNPPDAGPAPITPEEHAATLAALQPQPAPDPNAGLAASIDQHMVQPPPGAVRPIAPEPNDFAHSPVARQLGALGQGFSEGFNSNTRRGGMPATVPGGELGESQHPGYGAVGHGIGALAGGALTLATDPATVLKHITPEFAGGDSGHAFRQLMPGMPDVIGAHTPAASAPETPHGIGLGALSGGPSDEATLLDLLKQGQHPLQLDPSLQIDPKEVRNAGDTIADKSLDVGKADSGAADAVSGVQQDTADAIRDTTAETKPRMDAQQARADNWGRQLDQTNAEATRLADEQANAGPNHYWNSLETPQKIMAGIGMVISGFGSGMSGQKNAAVEQIDNAIERDAKLQAARISTRHTQTEGFKSLADIAHQGYTNEQARGHFIAAQQYNQAAAQLDATASKYAGGPDGQIAKRAEQAAAQMREQALQHDNAARTQEIQNRHSTAQAQMVASQTGLQGFNAGIKVLKNNRDEMEHRFGGGYDTRAGQKRDTLTQYKTMKDQLGKLSHLSTLVGIGSALDPSSGTNTEFDATRDGIIAAAPPKMQAQVKEMLDVGKFGRTDASRQAAIKAATDLIDNEIKAQASSVSGQPEAPTRVAEE